VPTVNSSTDRPQSYYGTIGFRKGQHRRDRRPAHHRGGHLAHCWCRFLAHSSYTTTRCPCSEGKVASYKEHVPGTDMRREQVSDGPNGIRGNFFFMSTPAKCLPCATALGATWDPELIEEVGLELLAGEAKLRAASIALAPTCNIQRVRSPISRTLRSGQLTCYIRTLSVVVLSNPSLRIRSSLVSLRRPTLRARRRAVLV
jgi:hypothetical protein